jgi:superfamily I DNA/RNA helicase
VRSTVRSLHGCYDWNSPSWPPLLTVHGSKGLEFKVVILPDCTAKVDFISYPVLVYDRELGLVGKSPDADSKL